MRTINPAWQESMLDKIAAGQPIDVTMSNHGVSQWLIVALSTRGKAYKVYTLGAGVKRITTSTDICPCCKQAIKGGKDAT